MEYPLYLLVLEVGADDSDCTGSAKSGDEGGPKGTQKARVFKECDGECAHHDHRCVDGEGLFEEFRLVFHHDLRGGD